jgi:simple sugar transport system permease protein
MVPLLFTGLGMVVAWRSGIYNIGGEGQFVVGALVGCAAGRPAIAASWPPVAAIAVILAGAIVGGVAWAAIAGWLYARRGVEVVISTILLNFVAIQLLGWAVSGPLQEAKRQVPLTDLVPDRYMLARFDRQMDLHAGLFVALAAAVAAWVFLFYTAVGFQLRVAGENARLARANQIDPTRMKLVALSISGGLCGLAGGVEYLGTAGQLGQGFSQQWGFLGIPVALLGGLHPLLVIVSAFVFGALFSGSENLARFTPAGTTLIYVIQAAAVLGFVGIQALGRRIPQPEAL